MYIFTVCLLATLIPRSFSLNHEAIDLNSISSYETLDFNENFDIWNDQSNEIALDDAFSPQLLEKLCKNSNDLIYITKDEITIDCKAFNNGNKPIDSKNIIKRSADEFEGSGDESEVITETVTTAINEEETTNQEVITEELTTVETTVTTEAATTIVIPKEEQKEEIIESDKFNEKDDTEMLPGRSLLPSQKEENKEGANSDNDVKTDESTQDTTKKAGAKDTTILVGLLVAVLIVGALAFAYNFVKKRKQRSADLEAVERNSEKRNIPNLSKENEAEKKPLMDDRKEVEMVDMKKESTEVQDEASDNPPNDVNVKS